MKLVFLLLGFLIVFEGSVLANDKCDYLNVKDIAQTISDWILKIFKTKGGDDQTFGTIGDIIRYLLKTIEGEKNITLGTIDLGSARNSLKNLELYSHIENATVDIEDSMHKLNIKALYLPVKYLRVNGDYSFEKLEIPGLNPFYGVGDVNLNVKNVTLFFRINMKYSVGTGLWRVTDVDFKVDGDDIKLELTNFMDGEPIKDFFLQIINGTIKIVIELLPEFMEEYNTLIKLILQEVINNIWPK